MASKNKKQIIFYSTITPSVLTYKVARLFKKNNYETVLFVLCEKNKFDQNLYKKAFDKIICSNFQFSKPSLKTIPYVLKRSPSLIKFLISMQWYKPGVFIGIAGSNWQIELAHRYFFKKTPFIYFPYDIRSHYFDTIKRAIEFGTKNFEITAEKYCFDNADAIIHKGAADELNFIEGRLFKKIDYKTKPQLNFLPYCLKEFRVLINKNKLSKKDKETHVVYLGWLPDTPNYFKRLMKMFQDLFNQKIHMHIYMIIVHISKKEEEIYIKNFFPEHILKNKYFHLHNPLNPEEIISETSKYDFGFLEAWELDHPGDISSRFTSGNKFATYLEAGIPIIYEKRLPVTHNLMTKYKVGIPFNPKNIKDIKKRINKLNYKKLEENIIKARQDFDMDKNFPRLEKFVKKIIKKKKSQ